MKQTVIQQAIKHLEDEAYECVYQQDKDRIMECANYLKTLLQASEQELKEAYGAAIDMTIKGPYVTVDDWFNNEYNEGLTQVKSWRGGKPRPKRKTMIPQRTLTGWEENRMRDRETQCLTPGIDFNDYTIVSYLCGTRLDSLSGMNWSYFDFVSLINSSTNPIDKTTGYHFTATRKRGEKEAEITVVVAIKNEV